MGSIEFDNIGLDDIYMMIRNILCIEWGEKIKKFIKRDYLILDFNYIIEDEESINKRKIILESSTTYGKEA